MNLVKIGDIHMQLMKREKSEKGKTRETYTKNKQNLFASVKT